MGKVGSAPPRLSVARPDAKSQQWSKVTGAKLAFMHSRHNLNIVRVPDFCEHIMFLVCLRSPYPEP